MKLRMLCLAVMMVCSAVHAERRVVVMNVKPKGGVAEEMATMWSELNVARLEAKGITIIGPNALARGMMTAEKARPDLDTKGQIASAMQTFDSDEILVTSVELLSDGGLQVFAGLFDSYFKPRVADQRRVASQGNVSKALGDAVAKVMGAGAEAAGNAVVKAPAQSAPQPTVASLPEPQRVAVSAGPVAVGGTIRISRLEDKGCLWRPASGGVAVDYIMNTSDLHPMLHEGDVITHIDGVRYQGGMLSHVRRKLIDGAAQSATLRLLRSGRPVDVKMVAENPPDDGVPCKVVVGAVLGVAKFADPLSGAIGDFWGELAGGRPSGYGRVKYGDGSSFRGVFQGGSPAGRGVHTWSDGRSLAGFWKKGSVSGDCTVTTSTGKKVKGKFSGSILDPKGRGTLVLSNGSRYEGEFSRGLPHGQGKTTAPNGETLEGGFADGHPHGEVTTTAPDGSKITTNFKNGARVDGPAKYTSPTGVTEAWYVENGQIVKRRTVDVQQQFRRDVRPNSSAQDLANFVRTVQGMKHTFEGVKKITGGRKPVTGKLPENCFNADNTPNSLFYE